MRNKFKEDYNYMAETYYYPGDKSIILNKFSNYTFNINDLWLVKPPYDYGGNGIHILKSLNEIKLKQYLITKYITNLDLIDKKKYDLRILVLIVGLKPLINDKNIHLTNIHVNAKNKPSSE